MIDVYLTEDNGVFYRRWQLDQRELEEPKGQKWDLGGGRAKRSNIALTKSRSIPYVLKMTEIKL